MKITIAGKPHEAHRPGDLDQRMIAAFGVSASEAAQMARDTPTPANLARAIAPFIELDHVSLGAEIAKGGTVEAVEALNKIYADPAESSPAAKPADAKP